MPALHCHQRLVRDDARATDQRFVVRALVRVESHQTRVVEVLVQPGRRHQQRHLIGLRLRVPVSWSGDSFTLSVELQDADGASLLAQPLTHSVNLPPRRPDSRATDLGLVRSFTFNNLVFQREGMYSFVILVDGDPVSRLRFAVRQRPEGPPRAI